MNRKLNIYLLLTLALCLLVTKASAYNVVDEIVGFMLDKRQDNNSTSIPPSSTSTTTRTTSTTTTPSSSTTSTNSRSSTASSTSTRSSSSSRTSSGDDGSTTSATTTLTTATTTRAITTVTYTVSGKISVSTGFTSETTVTTPTAAPGGDDNGGGISTGTRNTIIGVVVGVGGVIMIGALAIVAYRLRKRKTSGAGAGYADDLGAGSPSTGASSRPQDAFKATLDQYHKPQGTVNPSANF